MSNALKNISNFIRQVPRMENFGPVTFPKVQSPQAFLTLSWKLLTNYLTVLPTVFSSKNNKHKVFITFGFFFVPALVWAHSPPSSPSPAPSISSSSPSPATPLLPAPSSSSSPSFCDNPISFICQNKQDPPGITKLKTQSKAFAQAEVKKKLGVDVESLINVHHSYRKWPNEPAVVEYAKLAEQKTRELWNYLPILQQAGEEAKKVMKALVQKNTAFTETEKKAAIHELDNYRVLTFEQIFKSQYYTRGYLDQCTPSGYNNNAYVYTRTMVFCPGMLLKTMHLKDGERLHALLPTMFHEMGHMIDRKVRKTVYDKYTSCLETNYSSHPINGTGVSETHGLPFESLVTEIMGDYWSSEGTAAYLGKDIYSRDLSADTKNFFLRHGWDVPCTHMDGTAGGHPMGWFRLEVILRRNPNVANVMGCSQTYQNTQAVCTLAGETTPPPVCSAEQVSPHWKAVGNKCLPSCGQAKTTYCSSNDCQGLEAAGGSVCQGSSKVHDLEAYTPQCCLIKKSSPTPTTTTPAPICSANQVSPHWKAVGSKCLPSCGNASIIYCNSNNCQGLKVAAGNACQGSSKAHDLEAYDTSQCCMVRKPAPICSANQVSPHWKAVGNKCLPSCSHAKTVYCSSNNCQGLKVAAGGSCQGSSKVRDLEAYNTSQCCLIRKPAPVCSANQVSPHWKAVGNKCLPSCGHAKTIYCSKNNCQGLEVAGGSSCRSSRKARDLEAYTSQCCLLRKSSPPPTPKPTPPASVCSASQVSPHWKAVGNKCLPSCGHAKTIYCSRNNCQGLKAAGGSVCQGSSKVRDLEAYTSQCCLVRN